MREVSAPLVLSIIEGRLSILLVRDDESFLKTPGGKVRPGENYLQAARREAKEELGINIYPLPCYPPLIQEIHVEEIGCKYRFITFVARTDFFPVLVPDPRLIEYGWFALDALESIEVAKNVINALSYYRIRNK